MKMDHQLAPEPDKISTEEELLELAKKELLRDIKCASMRAEQFGAHSWAKPQKYVPSKRFLRHMLVSASRNNHKKTDRWKGNKTSKITSAIIHQSQKHNDMSEKDKFTKQRRSRWDSSPQHSKSSSHHGHEDKETKHHHIKSKHKKKTK